MNALANLLVLLSKFTLAVLAPKVVPKWLPRGLKEAPRKALWEALGLPWDRLGPTWDRFRIVLRSFLDHLGFIFGFVGDLFGISWGSSGSHFFDFSEFASRAQTPIIRTPWG